MGGRSRGDGASADGEMTMKTFLLTLIVALLCSAPVAQAAPPTKDGMTCVKVTVEVNGIDVAAYNWTYNVDVIRQSLRDRTSRFAVNIKHPSVCERRIGTPNNKE